MERPPFPFIVGCGRSGTTLLRAMLDAHPDLAIPGESYFPVWLSRPADRYGPPGRFAYRRFAQDLAGHNYFAHWGLTPADVLAALERADPSNFADAVRAVYALYASERGKPRYGDKTPVFVEHIERLARLFPEAVFVHLVRDGRNVAQSILDVGWGPSSLDRAALYWATQVRRGLRAGERLGPRRYLDIAYEDLVEEPEVQLAKICSLIDLEFSDRMLAYPRRAKTLLAGLPNPEEHGRLSAPPNARRDWRQSLSAEDVQVFDLLAGDVLARTGYARTEPFASRAPSVAARSRAARARFGWLAAHLRRSLRRTAWRARHLAKGVSRQQAGARAE